MKIKSTPVAFRVARTETKSTYAVPNGEIRSGLNVRFDVLRAYKGEERTVFTSHSEQAAEARAEQLRAKCAARYFVVDDADKPLSGGFDDEEDAIRWIQNRNWIQRLSDEAISAER